MAIDPQRAQALFLAALELSDSVARVKLLDRECVSDEALRQRVEALLAAHEAIGGFGNEPSEPACMDTIDSPENIRTGTMVAGRYKLIEAIGEGGMGTVWMAEQKEPVKRKVAIKLVKAGMDSRQVLARFEAERQALAMMDHPNIARVFDGGMTEQGRPFFAMEFVKGVPLTDYCDRARLSLVDRLNLFINVCQAVQHAHQKGIIHRDLKPSNILICLYDGNPVPKVIDFGLAKAMHQSLTEQTLHTAFGTIVGTPLYMSPEQAEHNNLDVDTRTDIYSLGVILYELLTGTTPLEGKQLKEAAYAEFLRLIKEVEPPKPSTRLSDSASLPSIAAQRSIDPKQLSKSLTGDLDWIVMKAIEKERGRRYETALSLASDVRCYLSNHPVSARKPSIAYRLRKLIRRNQTLAASIILVIAALTVALVASVGGLVVTLRAGRALESTKNDAIEGWKAERIARTRFEHEAYRYGVKVAYEAWNRRNRNEFEQVMRQLDTETNDAYRGFEWDLLRKFRQELAESELIETGSAIASLAYDPGGRYLAIGCETGVVHLYDRLDRSHLTLPEEMRGGFVSFSNDGRYLSTSSPAAGSWPCQIWEISSLQLVTWLPPESSHLSCVRFSPSCDRIAGVTADGNVEVRKAGTGEHLWTCTTGYDRAVQFAFSDDGLLLAVVGRVDDDAFLSLWQINGEQLDSVPYENRLLPQTVEFTPDGSVLMVNNLAWQVSEGELVSAGSIDIEGSVYSFASHNGELFAFGSADQSVELWSPSESRIVHRLIHSSLITAVAFSPGGNELAVGSRDNQVEIWNARLWRRKNETPATISFHPPLAIAPNGDIATSMRVDEGTVFKIWSPIRDAVETIWTEPSASFFGAAFSPTGNIVASASDNGFIRLRFNDTGKFVERKVHTEMATCLAFSPNEKQLVSAGSNGEMYLWDLATLETVSLPGGPVFPTSLAFSSSGLLACGGGQSWSQDGHLVVWDFRGSEPCVIYNDPCPETVRSVAWSPDGKLLGMTYKFSAGLVQVRDIAKREVRFQFPAHANKVTTLTFSTDGRRLITGSDDGTVRFWELEGGNNVGTLQVGHWVRAIGVNANGNALVTLSRDGWLRNWQALP